MRRALLAAACLAAVSRAGLLDVSDSMRLNVVAGQLRGSAATGVARSPSPTAAPPSPSPTPSSAPPTQSRSAAPTPSGTPSPSPRPPRSAEPTFVCSPVPSPSAPPPPVLRPEDAAGRPPLRVGCLGLWTDARGMLSDLPLLADFLRLASGRRLEPTGDLAAADVLWLGVFHPRAGVLRAAADARARGAVTVFVSSENDANFWGGAPFDHLNGAVDVSLGQRRDLRGEGYLHTSWWVLGSGILALRPDGTLPLPLELTSPAATVGDAAAAAWAARPRFAAVLARHGGFPREQLVAALEDTGRGRVSAPGKFHHNMDWPRCLPDDMGTGKPAFLRSFRFTVCPENSLTPGGYHTEKLPTAHMGGAVPLYWGDADGPDPEVWNPRRVLRFNGSNMPEVLRGVALLEDDPAFRAAWFAQPVLTPGAQEWVNAWGARLLAMLRRALARRPAGSRARALGSGAAGQGGNATGGRASGGGAPTAG